MNHFSFTRRRLLQLTSSLSSFFFGQIPNSSHAQIFNDAKQALPNAPFAVPPVTPGAPSLGDAIRPDQIPALDRLVSAADAEMEKRSPQYITISPVIVDVTEPAFLDRFNRPFPGTVTVIIRPRSKYRTFEDIAARLRSDFKSGFEDIDNVVQGVRARAANPPANVEEAIKALPSVPCFANIVHQRRYLAKRIPIFAEGAVLTFPYNGGRLGEITIESPNSQFELEAIAIVRSVKLTQSEKAFLDRVDSNYLWLNTGPMQRCYALCLVGVAYVVASAIVTMQPSEFESLNNIPESEFDFSSPTDSALKLTRLREKLLYETYVRSNPR